MNKRINKSLLICGDIDSISFNNQILGIMLPTVKTTKNDLFNKCLQTFYNMKDLAPISTVLINFQQYSTDEVDVAVDRFHDLGFKVLYSRNTYDVSNNVPLNEINNDTADLMENALAYLRIDDDMRFNDPNSKYKSPGRQFVESVHYLLNHPKCGIVMHKNAMLKSPGKNMVGPHPKQTHDYLPTYISLGCGYVFRNLRANGFILPEPVSRYLESRLQKLAVSVSPRYLDIASIIFDHREEVAFVIMQLIHGYYVAVYPETRVTHITCHNAQLTPEDSRFHNWGDQSLDQSIYRKFVRNPVPYEIYRKSSGLDYHSNPEKLLMLTSLYPEDQPISQLYKELLELRKFLEPTNCQRYLKESLRSSIDQLYDLAVKIVIGY